MLEITIHHKLNTFTLDISLQVGQELVALFGPSGSGKSVTLQSVAGLVQPDEGRISLNDRLLFDSARRVNLPPQQRRVGYVMQEYTLFPHLSVAQNIAYGLNGSKLQKQQTVADMLDLIQLPGFAEHLPDELSGGQKQRIALARALVTNPEVLLLDEPFSALDAPTRAQLRAELRQLLQNHTKIPSLLVTHDILEANVLADKIVVVHEGRLLQVGPPAEIMHKPASLEVARLTGTQNCFAGQVVASTAQGVGVLVQGLRVDTPAPAYPFTVGDAVFCCIRPEQVILLRPGQDGSRYGNSFETTVVSVVADGLTFTLQLQLLEQRLTPHKPYDLLVVLPLHVYESLAPQVGEIWWVSLKKSAIHLIGALAGQ